MIKVQIAHPHADFVSYSFHHSMMRLTNYHFDNYFLNSFNFAARATTMQLVDARNELMRMFVDETDADYTFLIDTDMGFPADTISKLVAAELDVVGAVCYGQAMDVPDDLGAYKTKPYVTAYDMVQNEADGNIYFALKTDLDMDSKSPQQVAGTGTGCLLVSRNAAEKVRASYGDTWFDQIRYPKTRMIVSEDLSFCYRLATVGIGVYIHTGVRTSHAKTTWIQE